MAKGLIMEMQLKKKYHAFSEPRKWYNSPRHKNCQQFGGGASGSGKSRTKKIVKFPFSGRTLGGMSRRMSNIKEK